LLSIGEPSHDIDSALFCNKRFCSYLTGTFIGADGDIWNAGACGDNARGGVNNGLLWNIVVAGNTIEGCPIGNGDDVRCGVDEPEQLAESHDELFVGDDRKVFVVTRGIWLWENNASRLFLTSSFPSLSKRATINCWFSFGDAWFPNLWKIFDIGQHEYFS
jgi:hypothetical protein